jgi:deoxyribose-phosphate aldolase
MAEPSPTSEQASARLALACLDLTSLNDDDSAASTAALCAKALAAPALPAALCVWPRFAAQARAKMPAAVAIAAVANFPHGGTDVAAAVADARAIVEAGAQEVDLVLPWQALRAGDAAAAQRVVAAVRAACVGLKLKLIIESGELAEASLVVTACKIGLDEGVDFLKTSTGKTATSATPEAARVMLREIAAHSRGAAVGFKASGGIRRVADAALYIGLAREVLGESALGPQRLRFGASALLADIEAALGSDAGLLEPTRPGPSSSLY